MLDEGNPNVNRPEIVPAIDWFLDGMKVRKGHHAESENCAILVCELEPTNPTFPERIAILQRNSVFRDDLLTLAQDDFISHDFRSASEVDFHFSFPCLCVVRKVCPLLPSL